MKNKLYDLYLKSPEWKAILKKGMAKSYKNLVDMNILIRIKRNVYMINPNFIIPPENYKEANNEWEKIMNIRKDNR